MARSGQARLSCPRCPSARHQPGGSGIPVVPPLPPPPPPPQTLPSSFHHCGAFHSVPGSETPAWESELAAGWGARQVGSGVAGGSLCPLFSFDFCTMSKYYLTLKLRRNGTHTHRERVARPFPDLLLSTPLPAKGITFSLQCFSHKNKHPSLLRISSALLPGNFSCLDCAASLQMDSSPMCEVAEEGGPEGCPQEGEEEGDNREIGERPCTTSGCGGRIPPAGVYI